MLVSINKKVPGLGIIEPGEYSEALDQLSEEVRVCKKEYAKLTLRFLSGLSREEQLFCTIVIHGSKLYILFMVLFLTAVLHRFTYCHEVKDYKS